ncbi:MAG: site-specific integrase, partial [Eubacterium sp.]
LIKTALYSGLRRGEIMALTWDDVDLEKGTINVNKSYSRHKDETGKIRGMVDTPKTASSIRMVPIPRFVVAELKQHRAKQAELILLLANKYEKNNLVFCTDIGKYISISAIESAMRGFSKELGLDSLNMHDFRDTYATRLYELGYNEKTVQVLMGHSNIGVTMDIYTHVSSEMKTKDVYLLDELHLSLK